MKQIIWSNDSYFDDKAREYYQDCQREYLEDDGYTVSDEEWGEEVYSWLDAERMNLNVQVDGVIIAFGDLGLWRGRRQGYQILGSNLADILRSSCGTATATTSVPDSRTTTARTMCFTGWRKAGRMPSALPTKFTTLKLTRRVSASSHVHSIPMLPMSMAGKSEGADRRKRQETRKDSRSTYMA